MPWRHGGSCVEAGWKPEFRRSGRYAVILYLMPALLSADQTHRLELAWPKAHLEARRAALEVAVKRTARARALQAERERMRMIPSELGWHGLTWRAPAGGRLEGGLVAVGG
jgi:hypothetical protein